MLEVRIYLVSVSLLTNYFYFKLILSITKQLQRIMVEGLEI